MAIIECQPTRPGGGDPPAAQTSGTHRRRLCRPVLLGLGALLMAVIVVLAVLAGAGALAPRGHRAGH